MNEQKIKELKKKARKLQQEQYNLIGYRKNPRRFGEIEKELNQIWTEIDKLR